MKTKMKRLNTRRTHLINKELDSKLSSDEKLELKSLQIQFSEYVDRVAPLPFAELYTLEASIDKDLE